jgi:hypothetical protein
VVSFTLRPLHPQGKSPWYPLDRRLGGHQSRSGHSGTYIKIIGQVLRMCTMRDEYKMLVGQVAVCGERLSVEYSKGITLLIT